MQKLYDIDLIVRRVEPYAEIDPIFCHKYMLLTSIKSSKKTSNKIFELC